MKLIKLLTFCAIIFVSCSKDVNENPGTGDQITTTELSVSVANCMTLDCNEQFSVRDLSVEIYLSEQDAIMKSDLYKAQSLDNSNQVDFSIIDQEKVYIRIETINQGTYIVGQDIFLDILNINHEVIFIKGYSYSNDTELTLNQNHINFETPVVGQTSRYKYYYKNGITMSAPDSYDQPSLDVEIMEHLDGNRFMLEERINNADDWLDWHYSETSTNIWEFHEDSLVIISPDSLDILSPLLGLNVWNLHGGERVVIEYQTCESEVVDLEASFYIPNWWECLVVEQTTVCNTEYNNLSIYHTSSAGIDGDDAIRVYDIQNGIVRTIQINQMGNDTRGFDLEL